MTHPASFNAGISTGRAAPGGRPFLFRRRAAALFGRRAAARPRGARSGHCWLTCPPRPWSDVAAVGIVALAPFCWPDADQAEERKGPAPVRHRRSPRLPMRWRSFYLERVDVALATAYRFFGRDFPSVPSNSSSNDTSRAGKAPGCAAATEFMRFRTSELAETYTQHSPERRLRNPPLVADTADIRPDDLVDFFVA
jgi:hypothetical protein